MLVPCRDTVAGRQPSWRSLESTYSVLLLQVVEELRGDAVLHLLLAAKGDRDPA